VLILSDITIKENDLKNMIDKMAKENEVTEEMVIDALKRWLEEYSKK